MPDEQGALFDQSEISAGNLSHEELNERSEWTALPEFIQKEKAIKLVISVEEESLLDNLIHKLGLIAKRGEKTASAWWPPRPREDPKSLRFDLDFTGADIRFIKVDAEPYFTASVETVDGIIVETTPVLEYMKGWDSEQFVEECSKKNWKYERIDAMIPFEPEIQ